jgi:hypothetical protein
MIASGHRQKCGTKFFRPRDAGLHGPMPHNHPDAVSPVAVSRGRGYPGDGYIGLRLDEALADSIVIGEKSAHPVAIESSQVGLDQDIRRNPGILFYDSQTLEYPLSKSAKGFHPEKYRFEIHIAVTPPTSGLSNTLNAKYDTISPLPV